MGLTSLPDKNRMHARQRRSHAVARTSLHNLATPADVQQELLSAIEAPIFWRHAEAKSKNRCETRTV